MTEFNEDELHAPNWMNKEFFTEVLKNCEKADEVRVNDLSITPASAKFDHYASVIFRATVKYDTNKSKGLSKSLIVKIAPEIDGFKKEMLSKTFIFETEIRMYSETIPKFEEELRKIGDKTVLGARALYYSLEPRKCIIFEDIVPKGYSVLRDRTPNMEEIKLTLTKLAKWHAVSYKLACEGDKSVTSYEHGLFNESASENMSFLTSGMGNLIEILEKTDDLKQYVPKLKAMEKDMFKKCIETATSYKNSNPEGIFALCHGDFHTGNLMFKRNDKNELEDVMLIDFQACCFEPAIIDILYGMYMIPNEELRCNHSDEIIYHYASCFMRTLKDMQFEGRIPKIFEFFVEILKHRHLEIYMLSTFIPFWYMMEAGVDSIEEMLISNEVRKKLYNTSGYIDQIRRVLPKLLYKGYLN